MHHFPSRNYTASAVQLTCFLDGTTCELQPSHYRTTQNMLQRVSRLAMSLNVAEEGGPVDVSYRYKALEAKDEIRLLKVER